MHHADRDPKNEPARDSPGVQLYSNSLPQMHVFNGKKNKKIIRASIYAEKYSNSFLLPLIYLCVTLEICKYLFLLCSRESRRARRGGFPLTRANIMLARLSTHIYIGNAGCPYSRFAINFARAPPPKTRSRRAF